MCPVCPSRSEVVLGTEPCGPDCQEDVHVPGSLPASALIASGSGERYWPALPPGQRSPQRQQAQAQADAGC